ncbi:helix-turn-helix domain-containing protein [Yinghuangia seranimata]|uniref:AraC-like ligand-binding domain-containing protein n=1 Tax=Yinghuangia seranimata TaxID=408067 RepID=UPI00248B2BAE|nr:helix-turn-helix domain-containing protein [Yinghuangia seranimata]MDI2131259.1 helix-turn-helix domain-containing protein [Yinghuangia seranimata]
MSVVLSTSPISPVERADYWHSLVSETFIPLDVTLHEREPSVGTITSDRLGPLQISLVEAGPQTVTRRAPQISRGGEEFMTVTLQHRGTARLTQDGRDALSEPGTFTCSDAARPYRREQPDDFRFTAFRVPKSELGVAEADLRAVTGTVFSGRSGASGLVAGYLERLAERASGFDPYIGRQLAMTAVDLLAVLVREHQGRLDPHASEAARGMLARVKEYILRNLADPDLSPERIASAHHMSVRYLHRLFESEGTTVGRWIHRERLERCRRDLARPSRSAPAVSAVAQRWGFVNPSHFSRVFRAAYGVSPREWQSSSAQH